ncbi:MAG: AAA family ATPase, partial [Candidatus Nanohaloarchaea archaeon]
FMATLEEVNEAFQDIFTTLFDGGDAWLELEEDGNIDSGLKIEAQPPDKDPHVIDSLSGGEKSLTAVAFVFALQEYDPSPFYIMDEIDAALDDQNSKRLSELLREYADEYQLIMISHNNETVRHADRAYGVSMQDGVSQVRSVELENN